MSRPVRSAVGWASPWPPQRSGIGDYSARVAPAVAEHLEIELLADDGCRPEAALADRFPVHPLSALPALAAERGYRAVVYHMGNHPGFHGGIRRALIAHPGVVVLHEAVLHHMVRELTLAAGDAAAYAEEMRYAYGPTGRALADRAIGSGVPLDPYRYPLFERVVDAARAVVVHSRTARERVLAARPRARVEVIPFYVEPPAEGETGEPARAAARAELGLDPRATVIATFGYLTDAKRLGPCLAAFARLRARRPDAIFVIAGEVDPRAGLDDAIGALGLGDAVRRLGRLPPERFEAAMRAADLALNLRHPTAGETSATLMRLLALGVPSVVTDIGSYAEIPDGCVAKVPPDAAEVELLSILLERLAGDPALRAAMGAAARRWTAAQCALPAVAAAYAALIEEVVRDDLRPPPVVPPLAPYPPEDLLAELLRRIGAERADLAPDAEAADAEAEAAAGVARAVVELGLDGPF